MSILKTILMLTLSFQAFAGTVTLAPLKAQLPLDKTIKVIEGAPAFVPGTLKLAVAFNCWYRSIEYTPCGRKEVRFELGSSEFKHDGSINLPKMTFEHEGAPRDIRPITVALALVFEINTSTYGQIPFGAQLLGFELLRRDDDLIRQELLARQWGVDDQGIPVILSKEDLQE